MRAPRMTRISIDKEALKYCQTIESSKRIDERKCSNKGELHVVMEEPPWKLLT